jgi:hypothetical protein
MWWNVSLTGSRIFGVASLVLTSRQGALIYPCLNVTDPRYNLIRAFLAILILPVAHLFSLLKWRDLVMRKKGGTHAASAFDEQRYAYIFHG